MGGMFSKKKEKRVLVLGLDNAGKTTFVERLKRDQGPIQTIPTLGFNVDKVKAKGLNLNMWDVGGQDNIRHLWRHYFAGTNALVFIVDGADRERMQEAYETFSGIVTSPELIDTAILIVDNKQDIQDALTPEEVSKIMKLNQLKQPWTVRAASTKTGQGCEECLVWLRQNLK